MCKMNNLRLYFTIIYVWAVVKLCHCTQFAYKLDGHRLLTLYQSSHARCYRECSARSSCLSYTYHVRSQACVLSRANETTSGANLTKAAGYVYSSKASWPEKETWCIPECSVAETCTSGVTATCKITACGPAPVSNNANVRGNVFAIGSRILHVCTYNENQRRQSTCLDTGNWSSIQDMSCLEDLKGDLFRIYSVGNNRFWHEDGLGDRLISSRYQLYDKYVKFKFWLQDDGSYKISVRGAIVFDHHDHRGDLNALSTITNKAPDSSNFFITKESLGALRIRAKRTGKLVRMDEDDLVSTRYNIEDSRSMFYLRKLD